MYCITFQLCISAEMCEMHEMYEFSAEIQGEMCENERPLPDMLFSWVCF